MNPSPRVNYDTIAHLYDTQPYRAKTVDPELVAFLEQCGPAETLSILDVGCGTGNQLVANRAMLPHARLVGSTGPWACCGRPSLKRQTAPGCKRMGQYSPFRPRVLISLPVNTPCIISRTRWACYGRCFGFSVAGAAWCSAICARTSVQIGSIMHIFRRLRLLIWRIFGRRGGGGCARNDWLCGGDGGAPAPPL